MKHRTFAFTDKIYNALSPKSREREADTELIKQMLARDGGCMISRFGSTELQALSFCRYYPLSHPLRRRTFYNIQYALGFFPVNFENL